KMTGERVFQDDFRDIAYRVVEIKINSKKNVDIENLLTDTETTYFLNEEKKTIKQESKRLSEPKNSVRENRRYVSYGRYSMLFIRFENILNNVLKEKLSLSVSPASHFNATPLFKTSLKTIYQQRTFFNALFYKQTVNQTAEVGQLVDEIIADKLFSFDALRQNLNEYSPIKDIKIDWSLTRRTIGKNEDLGNALIEGIDFQFFVNNDWVNWTQLSDGTKRLFYLIGSLTYAIGNYDNEVILIEEPEIGVHPHQLNLLLGFLKKQSKNKQIILSTHSPEVLNCLEESEVDRIIVARHEGKEGTKMYSLSEKEQAHVRTYMKHQASISDYWLQSGFEKDNEEATQ
ncbi:MAG: ATP-binding protein, partial [Saprospiraceae bacterium]|nr:ATP-binding protein [Saprospiraceae bacterium]